MAADAGAFLTHLGDIVGVSHVLTAPPDMAGSLTDWRGRFKGAALAVVRPRDTAEVAAVVRVCGEAGIAIVPQAGNTGLTGGGIPQDAAGAIVLNVSRLNRVREVDPGNNTLTADAGCILADIRRVADEAGRLFPMLLSSVGSCEVGGLVSTNAGGTGVLRYGNMRELVLGLEVVLPDGQVWDGLRALRKDNTGYDLKQLFVGAEGTLGIVTAAVLKLFPRPASSVSAMVSLDGVPAAIDLLQLLRDRLGPSIEAFELMSAGQIDIVRRNLPGIPIPMSSNAPWFVLIEVADGRDHDTLNEAVQAALAEALERGLVGDAVVAGSSAQANRIWEVRHTISEANKIEGYTVSNDTSVPISRLPVFLDTVTAELARELPQARVCHAGHVGDGNVHVIAILPRDAYDGPDALARAASLANDIVHRESVAQGGSISAEHGIGQMHVDKLPLYKSALELDMMRGIRRLFDPRGIMNPGKVVRM